ncbi:subtilisin-like protease SBT4.13 [Salvia divinorum]|uniref:Subtilisin-like protease SBT4.13 n=1 Tax=Salvia divinorum TaxID=28513 RepID=A0ABD1H3K3_SALDI
MKIFCSRRTSRILLVLVLILSYALQPFIAEEDRQVYIVYMGNLVERDQFLSSRHFNMLQQVVDSRFLGQTLVRSYTRSFNGFAAYLTAQEHEKLASHEGVVSIFPSLSFYPETTRSWDFMGFHENVHRNPMVESDTIIGVIDTGIWPESESFSDKGFSLPPKKWKGACSGGKNFTCNNKVIGARHYNSLLLPDDSARDVEGHGTHAASTAAGNSVTHASFYGIAKGTARGGVPTSRIAVYKVCNPSGCQSADILAAFDDAIADGVDIISISLGAPTASRPMHDPISVGALHASLKGILVVQAAGNTGLKKSTSSTVPWIFSVAASSTDRGIITKVALENGIILTGKGVNTFSLKQNSYPLVSGEDVTENCDKEVAKYCFPGCLEPTLVKGKIVACYSIIGIAETFVARAIGSVTLSDIHGNASIVLPIAASSLQEHDFHVVQSYLNSTKFPKVKIMTSESVKNLDAPIVASFSSRGPNIIIPDILKPDVTAPGIEILAAFSPLASPSDVYGDDRSVKYNILSGTSMSCPHVAGVAAYLQSLHPSWSPSAIKSALMTTAWRMDATKDPLALAEFSYGTGHIDPVRAADAGLVYETVVGDYVRMLCSVGYKTAKLGKIFGVKRSCITQGRITPKDLNYPSMTACIKANGNKVVTFSQKFTRVVTNVGLGNSTYKVTTTKSSDYTVSVEPSILIFGATNEKKSFEVVISGKTNAKMVSASLEWSDGIHRVRSPVVIYRDDL